MLLQGKSISFKPTGNKDPVWSHVTLEDGIKILEMKEVLWPRLVFYTLRLPGLVALGI